jgi:hypothetical protein
LSDDPDSSNDATDQSATQDSKPASGAPLILRGRSDSHEIEIWAFDLTASNLPNRLAFPLLVARTARDLTPSAMPESLQAGARLALRPNPRATEVQVVTPNNQVLSAPNGPTVTFDGIEQPGWYDVSERRGGTRLFEGKVAVNAGSPLESDLRPQPPPTLTVAGTDTDGSVRHDGAEVWPWLALAGLVLLLFEWTYVHRRTRRSGRIGFDGLS